VVSIRVDGATELGIWSSQSTTELPSGRNHVLLPIPVMFDLFNGHQRPAKDGHGAGMKCKVLPVATLHLSELNEKFMKGEMGKFLIRSWLSLRRTYMLCSCSVTCRNHDILSCRNAWSSIIPFQCKGLLNLVSFFTKVLFLASVFHYIASLIQIRSLMNLSVVMFLETLDLLNLIG